MKTKHPLFLTLLLCSLLLAYTSIADAQKVHACLILLGNDPDPTYRTSVDINQEAMIGLMEIVSRNADVHMTLMKSEPGRSGEVTHTHLVKMETKARTPTDQLSIIKPAQVTQWIRNLKVGPSDTVFIYFNGHGKVNRYGTHQLLFDKTGTKQLARDVVLEALRETPCRLKMLITDTCSTVQNTAHPAGRNALAWYGDIEAKPQFYARNLFLEHTGILDITATSPEIRTASNTDKVYTDKAYGDPKVGGFFTYALTTALVPAADTNRDDFLSWEEVFAATQEGTKWLCENHPLVKPLNTIQRPVDHALPMRAELATDPFADMVLIPAGKFQMGNNDVHEDRFKVQQQDGKGRYDEKPMHTVFVDTFYMDKYEVTNAQYKRFVDANPQWRKGNIKRRFHNGNYLIHWNGNDYPVGKADHPVVAVSWFAAMAYSQWAGKRLPTEAEWEKAARGGLAGKKYPWGDTIDASKANYNENVDDTTVVGSYAPNDYGLYDMTGNVIEWCLDKYDDEFYEVSPERNPISGGSIQSIKDNYTNIWEMRVRRGGSWANFTDKMRCAQRSYGGPSQTYTIIGFRCVRAVQ